MRIKDEARWIERVLKSMMPLCSRVLILDDHSTDETREICRRFSRVTLFESPFEGLNETRDKNYLLEEIERVTPNGEWVLSIDGDEEIFAKDHQKIRDAAATKATACRFQVLYLWDSETQIRTDGIYENFARPSMFRLKHGQRFHSAAGGGFHCGNVPDGGGAQRTGIRLLHYGYMHKEDRLRKFEWYNAPDKQPIPANEDGYRHMVIGDVFPATMRTSWGGPLRLQAAPQ